MVKTEARKKFYGIFFPNFKFTVKFAAILAALLIILMTIPIIAYASLDANFFGRSPSIVVGLAKQEPDPVEPGKQVEITFKLDNNGTVANNVIFEIVPEYPFSLIPDSSPTKYVGTLAASQNGQQSVILKYKFKVAQDAPDGTYKIKIRYKNDNYDSWIISDDYYIKVQTLDAIIGIDSFSTSPDIIAPGEKAKLKIYLKNYATSTLKNIKVSLGIDSSSALPFNPVGSTNEKIIPYIDAQSQASIEFELLVDSDASSKAYKIPLNIGYSDLLNKNYSKSNILTAVVGNIPELRTTLERTEVFTSDASGKVVIRIANKGTSNIKFLNVKVLENENVKVIGADESYIGKLDSDDFSTAEFNLYVKGKDKARIPVQLIYMDSNNKNYKDNMEVEIKLYSSNDAKKFGLKKNGNSSWIIIIAAVILIGYYFYRKRKNKK